MLANRDHLLSEPSLSHNTPKKRSHVQVNGMVMISLIAFVVLGLGLTYVGQRVHVMNLGYELAALERRLDEALREQEFLMLGIAQARSLDRVEHVATTTLGMVRPSEHQYVVLESNPADSFTSMASDSEEPRGILNAAIAWVTRHWPRVQLSETVRIGG